jgi:N-acetylglucosaminyldiphosphoundecaprenol N-acetyl-beta-D-mannosaminyltransferase
MYIFGIKIGRDKKRDILNKCFNALNKRKDGKPLFVVTLNPEILLTAKKDLKYRKIIDSFKLKIVDGVGIKLISWLKKQQIGDRISGADLTKILLEKAKKLNLEIGIIFNKNGWSSERDIKNIFKSKDKINLLGINREEKDPNLEKIKNSHLVLVALGHPEQEKLIHRHISKLPKIKLAIGIGGTLDFWTGKKKRAPNILRKIGLEWLWRLIIQPNRAKRILKATVIFSFLAIFKNKPQ